MAKSKNPWGWGAVLEALSGRLKNCVKTVNNSAPDENGNVNVAAYSLPTAGKNKLGGVKTTSNVTSASGLTPAPIIGGVPYYQNTTYGAATASAAGLMSSADKKKLDSVSDGATGKGSMTLLWTNSAPTAQFAAQTIALSLSAYAYLYILYDSGAGNGLVRIGQTGRVSTLATVVVDSNSYMAGGGSSKVTTSNTGVTFEASTVWPGQNSFLPQDKLHYKVPYQIYGLK